MITISAEEVADTYSIPTIMANRVIISRSNGGIRVVFGEMAPGDTAVIPRYAVHLSGEVAAELSDLLAAFSPE